MFMKKMKSRIAVILTVMMLISLFEVVGVFANGEQGSEPAMTTEAADVSAATSGLDKPAVSAYAGYESVHFVWAPVPGANFYKVDGTEYAADSLGKDGSNFHFKKAAAPGGSASITVQAISRVTMNSVGANDVTEYSSEEATVTGSAVQNGLYRLKIKKAGTLKSHGGPKATIRVYKNEVIYAYGFGGGKYIFKRNGSTFYCNKSRTKSRSVVYQRAFNYSPKDAEFFVNDKGLGSQTNSLVWASVYCQHVYFFTKEGGRWVCRGDWVCSTGKAATPSPTGVSGQKTIWKKIKKRHGIPYWSPYSDINSLHGKKKKWGLDAPKSNGCIREPNDKAYIIYTQAPKGTRVYIY